jgi:predicted kinase
MRGVAGSGKSTLAKDLTINHISSGGASAAICSTDNYHMIDGEYVFQPGRLHQFHLANQADARKYMHGGIELVIIDNTNIKRKDMQPYFDAGKEFGYEIEEIVVGEEYLLPGEEMTQQLIDGYLRLCAKRNTHGVPLEAIQRMAGKFEK